MEFIQHNAQVGGKNAKDYAQELLVEFTGDSRLNEILAIAGGCPIETLAIFLEADLSSDKT